MTDHKKLAQDIADRLSYYQILQQDKQLTDFEKGQFAILHILFTEHFTDGR